MSIEDMFDTMANAKPFASRLATVKGPGKHKLALDKYYLKNTQSNGTIIAADLVVVDSTIHAVGTEVSVAWFLNSGKHQWMRDKEAAKAQQFVKAIAESLNPGVEVTPEIIKAVGRSLLGEGQVGRGIVLSCKSGEPYKEDSDHCDLNWSAIPQTAAEIKAVRSSMESTTAAAAPAPAASQDAPSTFDLSAFLSK